MPSTIGSTNVYIINGRIVVAKNAIKAIEVFNEHLKEIGKYSEDVRTLTAVSDGSNTCPSFSAIIKEYKVSLKELTDWIAKVRRSNISDDGLARDLLNLINGNNNS